jgi:signal transduction histidine kinase
MKTKTKISIYFTFLAIVILTVFSGSVYYFAIRYSFDDFYKRLEIRAVVAAKALLEEDETDASVFEDVRKEHLEKLPNEKEYFIQVSPGKNFEKEAKELDVPVTYFQEILRDKAADYRKSNTFYAGIFYADNEGDYIVIVSAVNKYSSQHLSDLRKIFVFVLLFTIIFVLSIAGVFTRYVFTPVKNITKKVRDISTRSLHMRLSPLKGNDEVSELTNTFNDMLDRLETSFETQNNFISNASHELRTPLTSIIGETDLALSKPRTSEEYIRTLQAISVEAERLDNITKSLLFLAQTGFGGTKQQFEPVRVDELLWQAKSTIDRINPKNEVRIDFSMLPENEEKMKINGIENLLHLAITNIISNGCKYSNNKPVNVAVASTDERVIIIIRDEGIGIPEKDMPHIYDPFFRASNTYKYEGYGIGLPLARNIIRLHKGELLVNSEEDEGTVIQISFPIAE